MATKTKQTAQMSALGNIRNMLTPKKSAVIDLGEAEQADDSDPVMTSVEIEDADGNVGEDSVPMFPKKPIDLGMAESDDEDDKDEQGPPTVSISLDSGDDLDATPMDKLMKMLADQKSRNPPEGDTQIQALKTVIMKRMGKAGK